MAAYSPLNGDSREALFALCTSIVFDFVNPACARRGMIDCRCELRLDELERHESHLADAQEIGSLACHRPGLQGMGSGVAPDKAGCKTASGVWDKVTKTCKPNLERPQLSADPLWVHSKKEARLTGADDGQVLQVTQVSDSKAL